MILLEGRVTDFEFEDEQILLEEDLRIRLTE